MLPRFRRAVRLILDRRDVRRAVEEELDFHLSKTAEKLEADGMDPEAARREALRRFGDRERYVRDTVGIAERRHAATRRRRWAAGLLRDLRVTARSLGKRPVFAGTSVLVLGLGMAAATTVFSFIQGVLLRPLPYPEAGRLVVLEERDEGGSGGGPSWRNLVLSDVRGLREDSAVFEGVAGFMSGTVPFADGEEPTRLAATHATPSLFRVLRTPPVLGRGFTPDEAVEGAEPVALLGYGLWRRRFGADPEVVGRRILVNYEPATVIGVMPEGFSFPRESELWLPLGSDRFTEGFHVVRTVARLAPDGSVERAEAALDAFLARRGESDPDGHGDVTGGRVRSWRDELVHEARPALLVLAGAVGLLVLLVCVNVAGLLASRSLERRRELAVRKSLGASRARLARLVLTESLLLGVAGGILGLLLARLALGSAIALSPPDLPGREAITVNGRVLWFAGGLALLSGLAAGLVPALRSGRVSTRRMIASRSSGRGRGGEDLNAGAALVVAETALATLLLIGSGLLVSSFVRMLEVDTGIREGRVLTASVDLNRSRYPEPSDQASFFARLLERVEALPGVSEAAVSLFPPLRGALPMEGLTLHSGGATQETGGTPPRVLPVSPGYFRLLGIPVLEGRAFRRRDVEAGEKVALVSRSAARRFWGSQEATGRTFARGDEVYRILGVVGDVRQSDPLTPPPDLIYLPFREFGYWGGTLVLRTTTAPSTLVPSLRRLVWELDPQLPLDDVETVEGALAGSVAQPRFYTALVSVFAVLAFLVAVAGIYGIVGYEARRRLYEIGVRAALGARPRQNVWLLLRRGAAQAGIGILAGGAAAVALSRLLASLLYGTPPHDPAAFLGAAALVLAGALTAAAVPAIRASRVDPAATLRAE